MKKTLMPQEIEVWYLIPTIRSQFAKLFIKKGLSQKRAAEILQITEPAISQYLKSKRANEYKFNKKQLKEIDKSAQMVLDHPETMMREIYDLCIKFRKSKVICDVHKSQDSSVPKNCDVCFS